MQVHFDTYKVTGQITTKRGEPFDLHSVEITIGKDRREVACGAVYNGWIKIFDLAVRFSHGSKMWPGSATYWIESGNVNNLSPNIDKRGHFILAGFMADYENRAVRSQHNAVA
jgi:hypothetical protein